MLRKRETASGRWAVIPAPLAGRLLSWGRGRKWWEGWVSAGMGWGSRGSVLVPGGFGGLGDLANISGWAGSIPRGWSPCGDGPGPVVSTEIGQSILE